MELRKKEAELKKNQMKKKVLREIGDLRQQIDNTISEEIYWNLKKTQQRSFEFANKPAKLLAGLLKKKKGKDGSLHLEMKKKIKNNRCKRNKNNI